MSSVVDLPAPFGPSSATVSPGPTVASMPRTARTEPYDFVRPRSSIPPFVVAIQALCLPLPSSGGSIAA